MAVIFDTTIGGTNTTSYLSVSDADDYWSTRIYSTDWDGATTAQKQNALMFASRLLDDWVDWKGNLTKEDQALRWPRYGVYNRDGWLLDSDAIPPDIKDATAELAGFILANDPTAQPGTLGFKNLKVGEIQLDIDKMDRDKYGALPDSVLVLVEHYGTVRKRGSSGTVSLVRA